jgi:hypothetical protein
LCPASAVGAKPRASAAAAPIVKVIAIVLHVMVVSFASQVAFAWGGDHPDRLFPFPLVQAAVDTQKRPRFLYIF